MSKYLPITGLAITLVGAGLGAYGTFVTEDQAIEIGVTRLAGETKEQSLRLPAVKNLVSQSNFARYGFLLIAAGTGLQILGVCRNNR
jgi:hypothetical protein